jgi:hypothetical protein
MQEVIKSIKSGLLLIKEMADTMIKLSQTKILFGQGGVQQINDFLTLSILECYNQIK